MFLAVFELEPGHRNQRKKQKVWEAANLGHSLPLSWCLRSGGGRTWGGKTWPSLCNHGVSFAPRTHRGRG